MSADFDVFAAQCRTRADAALKARLPAPDSQQPDLAEAMAYCLFNGGKRIRPTLVYATGAALGATDAPGLDTLAAAVECVHAYSLAHDDLPAMDDESSWARLEACTHSTAAARRFAGHGRRRFASGKTQLPHRL